MGSDEAILRPFAPILSRASLFRRLRLRYDANVRADSRPGVYSRTALDSERLELAPSALSRLPGLLMRFSFHFGAAAALASLLAGAAARAEDRIGNAALAINDVQRVDNGAAIGVDDSVFRNESVRTGRDSSAKFVFVDSTNLALGASSTVKLDRFVFNDDASYSRAAVNLAKGAFRFSSGNSPKDAYEIKTGNATIGVRGTVLDILTRPGRTVVSLVEGQAVVCPRSRFDGLRKFDCGELLKPGDTIVVTSAGTRNAAAPFSFAAAACGSDPALCSRDTVASLTGPGLTPAGKLCGR
jgi:ferric-dicitrate binding protein FerR (iron transport regulator)